MFCYCGNNPVNRFDESGRSWKEISDFFKNTFGVAVYATYDNEIDIISVPMVGGVATGAETGSLICGNPNKPIVFYCKNASTPFKFWEYQIGIQVNTDENSGVALSVGAGEFNFSNCENGIEAEFKMGISTIAMTVSKTEHYKSRSTSFYTKCYINTPTIFAAGLLHVLSGSMLVAEPVPVTA